MRERHNSNVVFVTKKYEGKRALTVHIRTIHGGKKLLKCDICDKKYSTEAHLKTHCNHSYRRKSIKSVPEGEKWYISGINLFK